MAIIPNPWRLSVGLAAFLWPAWPACLAAADPPPAVVLTIEGSVEVLGGAGTNWTVAAVGKPLQVHDQVRTGARSRAAIRLSNLSVLRVSELMTFELQPPRAAAGKPVIDLKAGAAYFFSRDKPQEIQLRTPLASGAIRGTEFAVNVAADGRTLLSLIDGEVELANGLGSAVLTGGDQATVAPGQKPIKTALLNAANVIQWTLYYPGVLDPAELGLAPESDAPLAESLRAYRRGDLLAALHDYPTNRQAISPPEIVYYAGLLLAVGLVDQAASQLDHLPAGASSSQSLAAALRQLMAAVKFMESPSGSPPQLASEWLAQSYYAQSRADLAGALASARGAVAKSPSFAFGWERVAELEFGFGRASAALEALDRSLALAPGNAQAVALRGFLLSGQNRIKDALASFEHAIALDGALANAWLGRGLCRIRIGEVEGGREDLEMAAALEPNRALLRSYLGKAFDQARDFPRAEQELRLARRFDAQDPTSWLYAALLHQQENRINEAIREVETSETLNQNRGVYRSRLLLDQDEAVRGANLAAMYNDAGMDDVSAREAGRAVSSDYANYSSHLFLANSYNNLRDPNQINLRYETPWLSEFLMANLLAPVGAGTLSQAVSQQEYSRLFDRNGFGVASSTEYSSRGAWTQTSAQYGSFDNFGYAVDSVYRSDPGWYPNDDQQQTTVTVTLKDQVTPADSIFLQTTYYNASAGDLTPYYSPAQVHLGLRTHETQEPLLILGYHHEWGPGMHTLFLAGRFQDSLDVSDPDQELLLLAKSGGQVIAVPVPSLPTASLDYHSDLEIYSAELQQIWQGENNGLVAGARYQAGWFDTSASLGPSSPSYFGNSSTTSSVSLASSPISQNVDPSMQRVTGYAYDNWRPFSPLLLTAGLACDYLEFPLNYRTAPLASGQSSQHSIGPKAGFTWTPAPSTAVRFAFTRSLGGVSFDQSARLEPTQVAGFNQAFRSLIPEAVSGSLSGAKFETFNLAWDQKFATGTYLTLETDLMNSEASSATGDVDVNFPPSFAASTTPENLDYQEKDLLLTVNQLLGDSWSLGARYWLSQATLDTTFLAIPASVTPGAATHNDAVLNQLTLFAAFNHRSGFFGRAEALWTSQSNRGYQPDLPGDDFWQLNLYAGYRFWHRRGQLQIGMVNLTDRDYQLNPLNLYNGLPRGRNFVTSCSFAF